jgi:hypothetical protein
MPDDNTTAVADLSWIVRELVEQAIPCVWMDVIEPPDELMVAWPAKDILGSAQSYLLYPPEDSHVDGASLQAVLSEALKLHGIEVRQLYWPPSPMRGMFDESTRH